ncbi:hypothetical protein SUGI_0612860 [Cryptomeria japonica]|uniref:uncharacterized protein LOC131062602 isoform X2 n=1 Tax=Cryptomeria japonica TaxID=3369 RepID=UPI0024149D5C|nr:uncharacterized protein LOC131062602 isoform X2 [Cryptomeria japonica]GLJ30845.1 hypothetical protein SUGI_0612860 [Cryptomeria japonica]
MMEMEKEIEECIAYRVGLPVSARGLGERLAMSEEAQREAVQQGEQLQERLRLAREEAALCAGAIRKHVAEADRWRKEADRLEKECALYLRDREVFMEAADEADERANQANHRAIQANNELQRALTQIEQLKFSTVSKAKMDEELGILKRRITELESANLSLQNDHLILVKRRGDDARINQHTEQLEQENRELRTLLEIAKSGRKDKPNGVQIFKHGTEEGSWAFKLHANSFISSMADKGLWKVAEEEKQEAIDIICSNFEAFITQDLRGRLEASEKTAQLLTAEVQSLRQEKNYIMSNLEKAENEVQLLDDENRELRLRLRGRFQGSDGHAVSPLQTMVKASRSPKSQL